MDNTELYEKCRNVPENAKRAIQGGKLKGKTDINPMWRIRMLTEMFGPCGFGWNIEIKERWIDHGANGEEVVNVKVELKVKYNGEWSEGIIGIGGNTLIAAQGGGMQTNDEAYKMAYTDAISVACKMLGMAADVYWEQDKTKYTNQQEQPRQAQAQTQPKQQGGTLKSTDPASPRQIAYWNRILQDKGYGKDYAKHVYGKEFEEMTAGEASKAIDELLKQ